MIYTQANYTLINESTKNKVIILPLGAIEQHGPHLSVSTDTDLVTEIARKAESILVNDILLCPSLPFGSSNHHLSFGGTISVSPSTYTKLIIELVESLLKNGFRRIVLLNGHGGNITPVKQALSELCNKYDASHNPNIVLVTYWELAQDAFTGMSPMESPALSHACEYETSLLLHLFPEKVFLNNIKRAQRPESNNYIPWEDDEPYKGVTIVKRTEFISSNGSSGEPQLGTSEKGEYLFENAVSALVKFITSFKGWPYSKNLINSEHE
jgi:creatinine amidohydrolase